MIRTPVTESGGQVGAQMTATRRIITHYHVVTGDVDAGRFRNVEAVVRAAPSLYR